MNVRAASLERSLVDRKQPLVIPIGSEGRLEFGSRGRTHVRQPLGVAACHELDSAGEVLRATGREVESRPTVFHDLRHRPEASRNDR